MNLRVGHVWAVMVATCVGSAIAADPSYDPVSISNPRKAETVDTAVADASRSREIPLRVYLPATMAPAPVVLFSHGLGGSRAGNPYLGEHWSAAAMSSCSCNMRAATRRSGKTFPCCSEWQI